MADRKSQSAKADADARPDNAVSSQHQFSTYKENKDVPEDNPSPGPQVIQELGTSS